jgi:hypothetical protein
MANTFARAKSVTVENANATLSVATTVGHGPIADMSVDGDTLVVSNYGDHNVVMLDAATLAVTGGVAAREPFALVAAGGRAHVGVASANYDAVAVIDTRTGAVLRSYPLSFNVTAMAASPDGERAYAGRAGDGGVDVSVIDTTAQRVGTIYLAKGEDANIDALRVDVRAAASTRRCRTHAAADSSSWISRPAGCAARWRWARPSAGWRSAWTAPPTSDLRHQRPRRRAWSTWWRTASWRAWRWPRRRCSWRCPPTAPGRTSSTMTRSVLSTETLTVVDTISVGARPSCVAVGVDRLTSPTARVASRPTGSRACADGVRALATANPLAAVEIRELEPAGV